VLPAQATVTAAKGWRISTTITPAKGRVDFLSGVAAVSPGDAWVAGFSAKESNGNSFSTLIRHWNGKSWHVVTLPSKVGKAWAKDEPLLPVLTASSTKNVWLFTSFGVALPAA
jgi:sugar/nucleoside kinase (ribokinase family)